MPHSETEPEQFNLITIKELHPTFGAEISGVDFREGVTDEAFSEILDAITKYGVCVFRNTRLDDKRHIEFSSRFGELDEVTPYLTKGRKNRFADDRLFDVSNQEDDGSIAQLDTRRANLNKGNSLFHVDSSFNPRRAGYSLLRAHELPPPNTGGATQFADTHTAFADLPPTLKSQLVENDYVANHSLWHSRKKASPEFFADINPEDFFMSRHKLIQRHEASGRMNLYVAYHIHHIEGLPPEDSKQLTETLLAYASQPKYVLNVDWENNGDMVLWDNTCVMHRATGGAFEGKFKRDMRRTTVHDESANAWGLNEKTNIRMGLP